LNRPFHELKIDKIIDGLIQLRKKYTGQLWLEVFIVPGLNDTEDEIQQLKSVIQRINPDRVQLNTLDRPGAVAWVKPATKDSLEKIAHQLGSKAEIIANFQQREEVASYNADVESTILETVKRRPCTVEDLSSILGLHQNEINKYIETLLNRNLIRSEVLERGVFFKSIKK